MYTYLIGKKSKMLMNTEQCPGVEIDHINLETEEIGHMCCRMQESIHFIYIIRGAVEIQINQERIELYRGEGVFINQTAFYRLSGCINGSCECCVVTIHDELILNDELLGKHMRSVMENTDVPYMKLSVRDESKKILDLLDDVWKMSGEKTLCCELEVKSALYQILSVLCRIFDSIRSESGKKSLRESQKLYRMLVYLHENYKNKLTLTEIAENLGVSGGDYCRFFKKHMGQTPFEYLQMYRIEKTLPELLEKSLSITELSLKHGFNGSSYYAETFRKEMGCTPGEYRKWCLDTEIQRCPLKLVQSERMRKQRTPVQITVSGNIKENMPTHLL